jgi:hypothetical protein
MTTFFAMAENKNASSLFLDSDQDRLTDQEERMIGTDPMKADTDGDGYSDGKEVESGYSPLKPAPGDKIGSAPATSVPTSASDTSSSIANLTNSPTLDDSFYDDDAMTDLASDPSNPNLTNEMIGQLMQLTKEKATTSDSFASNPTYSSEDLAQITQGALQTVDITKDLPDIQDSEMNILPPVDDKDLSDDEIKTEQKKQIETYLAKSAFLLASNSPFTIDSPSNLESNIAAEGTGLITAVISGDTSKIDTYAQKAEEGIDQMKKMDVPYILKDIHRSMLQLAIYTLGLKDSISINSSDPMKSLASASSLQAVAQSATKIQQELSQILSDYGIEEVKFP